MANAISLEEIERRQLEHMKSQHKGSKPKFHKGKYGQKYDYYTCGNCGKTLVHGVSANWCYNCGYKIIWDNPRCLTGI